MSKARKEGPQTEGDRLREQLCYWRHNRRLYPGWLIAPYQTRDKVWLNTKYWIDTAFAVQDDWSFVQQLVLWRELAWRLQLCLQVLPPDAPHVLRKIVDSNEVHEVLKKEKKSLALYFSSIDDWPIELHQKPDELREDWVAIQLVYLAASRIQPDIECFNELRDSLIRCEYLTQDQTSEVSYQSCLQAIAEFDRERASHLLDNWPTQPEDPYLLVRKASVHLELGDRETAESLASTALRMIRLQPRTEKVNFWRLSREGWCLRFLYQLHEPYRTSKSQTTKSAALDDVRAQQHELDNELETTRCSPDTELKMLEERISKRYPQLQHPYTTTTPPDFDHGRTSETHHVGELQAIERLAPAINILVTCDLTGLPPRVDNVMFFEAAFTSALQWVRDDQPGLWSTFALRHGGIGVRSDLDPISNDKHDAIRRTTLETLPLEHISLVLGATKREVQRLVHIADVHRVSRTDRSRSREVWSLRNFGDVLARFSMCVDDEERESILTLAVRLTRVRVFREHPSFQETVFHLIERIVPYLTSRQVNEWLVELVIDFPMYGRPGDKVDRWPLITDFILLPQDTILERPDSKAYVSGVKRLISIVSDEHLRERTVAALRLSFLEKNKLLSVSEGQEFSDALWMTTDASGLPTIDDGYVSRIVHLDWPMVYKERAIQGLVIWITSNEVGDRFTEERGPDGNGRTSLTSVDPDDYLDSLLRIARHLRRDDALYGAIFDSTVRSHILRSILEWWSRERERIIRWTTTHRYFEIDPYERVTLVLRVIINCVLDRNREELEINGLLRPFLSEIGELRKVIPYSFPIYAFLDEESGMEYWDKLLVALWHSNRHVSSEALVACYEWQSASDRLRLPGMPEDVALNLIAALAKVSGEFGYHAYAVVVNLLVDNKFPNEHTVCRRLTDAVDSAATRLSYGRANSSSHLDIGRDVEMDAHFRRRLAGLICAMCEAGLGVGSIAAHWLEKAKKDRFVDVRRAANGGRWV